MAHGPGATELSTQLPVPSSKQSESLVLQEKSVPAVMALKTRHPGSSGLNFKYCLADPSQTLTLGLILFLPLPPPGVASSSRSLALFSF
jgi:hypothetical protein